jgi:hypothetical protein
VLLMPQALNRDSLYSSINSTAAVMADSAAFQTGCQRGVIMLQGLNVLMIEPLLFSAGDLAFFLDEGIDVKAGIRRCKQYSLQQRSLWMPGHRSADAYLAEFEKRDRHALLRQYSHEEYYSFDQRLAIPLGNLITTHDQGGARLSKATVARELNLNLRAYFGLGPKPKGSVTFDLGATSAKAGSAIADPIVSDAISAKAGSVIDALLLGAKESLGVSAKAPPALAAVTVTPNKFSDVRIKQEAARKEKEAEEVKLLLARSLVKSDPAYTAAYLA